MQRLDLTAAERPAYLGALRGHSIVRTEVTVLDLAGETVASLTPSVADGQVLVDRRARASRVLMLNFDDPNGLLDFDPTTPDDGALYLTHMLQVDVSTWVEELERFVTATPFLGPLRALRRDGITIAARAHSKEMLRRRRLGDTLRIAKGTPKVEAIRMILEKYGETRFAFPELTVKMPRGLSLGPNARGWDIGERIAESMNMQLFHRMPDGAATLRRFPRAPQWTFRTGDEGEVVGNPRISFDVADDFYNTLRVRGPKPRPGKKRVVVTRHAPEGHLLSPDGDLGGLPKVLNNGFVRSRAEARRLGDRHIEDQLLSVVQPRFEALPIYHLTEGDYVQLETEETMLPFRLDRFTLPISTAGRPRMLVGHHAKTTLDRDVA